MTRVLNCPMNGRSYLRSAAKAMLTVCVTFFWGVVGAEAGTLYVSPSGTDSTTCGTTLEPCRNPDYAVKRAVAGDTILLAGGTYQLPGPANLCSAITTVRSVVCVVDKSLIIRGGYAPSTWIFDPSANPTVIDGQNLYRGVHVFSSAPNMRLAIADVTIRNGLAQGSGAFGGGMNVDNAAVTLAGVTFQNNQVIGVDTGSALGGDAPGSALSIRSGLGRTVSLLSNVTFDNNHSLAGRGTQRGGYAFGALFVYGTTV